MTARATCQHLDADPECAACRGRAGAAASPLEPEGDELLDDDSLLEAQLDRLALARGCSILWPVFGPRSVAVLVRRCASCDSEVERPLVPHSLDAADGIDRMVEVAAAKLERQLAARCECTLGPLMPERDATPDELAAMADEPRPGVWVGDADADGRALTQDQTDLLIRSRLAATARERDGEVRRMLGPLAEVGLPRRDRSPPPHPLVATRQRGGIDSDRMVRLLAYRAWGDRDRRWFEPTAGHDLAR